MKYILTKTKENLKFKIKPKFIDGYTFTKKISITIYNDMIKKSIVKKKTDNKMDKLFNMFMFFNETDDEDDEGGHLLSAKIEEMQLLLLANANLFSQTEMESYLSKIDQIRDTMPITQITQGRGK